ncbi:MAG: GntR family transcriptional regulator [Deltaproteobacteria bacterium]|nr:GntR family transcriptional regulator [Deltaproteobacteria bacterium]
MYSYRQIWETIARDVQEDILNGRYKPGDRLKENELATKYSVSNTPVREALRYLERIGFVEIIPRTMARVRNISKKELENLFTIQSVLEELAVQQAVPNLRESDYRDLEQCLRLIAKFYREGNYPEYEKAHVRFHSSIWKASDNKELVELLQNIYDRVRRFRAVTRRHPDRSKDVAGPHREILDAVVQKDSKRAGKLVRAHLERFVKEIVAILEKEEEPSRLQTGEKDRAASTGR